MNSLAIRILSLAVLLTIICGSLLSFSVTAADSDTPTCWIAVEPMEVESGDSATLRWDSTNADEAWISDIGDVDTHGSYHIDHVYASKTYTLTVTGNGETVTCSTTVSLDYTSGTAVPLCTIYAVPSAIASGRSSTLHWTSSNAESASLTNYGAVNESGSRTVSPSYTTTYALTVWNSHGQMSQCQTTLYVDGSGYPFYGQYSYAQAPSCTITLNGYSGYGYNRSVNLTWWSTNATNAYISNIGVVGMNGVQTVLYPDVQNVYVLSVSGPGGNATCSTSGQVAGYPYNSGTQYPYLSLTQIPYTGLNLGPVGTALYWLGMMAFAASAAYFVVRMRPNAFMLFRARTPRV